MSSETRAIDISVGLFILLGLGSVVFLTTQTLGSSELTNSASYTLHARFDHIGDLKVRAPVALAGVTIGRVSRISVDPIDYQANVELRIDKTFDQLPIDTFASIATTGILGGKYVELGPGGDEEVLPARCPRRGPRVLQDQGDIEFTQSAILLENLIGKFMVNGKADKGE